MGFVEDSFTDTSSTALASHTGEVGATWAKHGNYAGGNIIITDANRARSNGSGTSVYYASGTPTNANYSVSSPINYKSSSGTLAGVILRSDTSGTIDCYAAHYHQSNARWELYKYVAGTGTLLSNYSQSLSASTSYTLKLEAIGTAIKVYVDGVERISVTDSSVSATGVPGLMTQGSATNTTGLHFDSFLAENASSAVNYDMAAGVVNVSAPVLAPSLALTSVAGVVNLSAPTLSPGVGLPGVSGIVNLSSPVLSLAMALGMDDGVVDLSSPVASFGVGLTGEPGLVDVSSPPLSMAIDLLTSFGLVDVSSPASTIVSGYVLATSAALVDVLSPPHSPSLALAGAAGAVAVESPPMGGAVSLLLIAASVALEAPSGLLGVSLGGAVALVSVAGNEAVFTVSGTPDLLHAALEVISRVGGVVRVVTRPGSLVQIAGRRGSVIEITVRLGGP